jgi:hypothetical protein
MRLYIYLYVCGRGDGAQIVGNEHERSDCWKPPFYCWFIFRRAESDSESLTPKCLFNADLTACGSRCASRGITALYLSLRMLFFFSFFFRKVFNLWNLIFLFFWLCVTFWKSFVLYFSGFFIGSRSVGHREIWRPIRIFFCGFCIEKKSPSSLGDTEGGIILTAEKEKRVPSWDSVGSPCPSTLVNSPLVYCLEPTSTHTCVCVIRTSLSHWMVIVKLCKTFFWKVKGRLFSLSSLVGFSTVF